MKIHLIIITFCLFIITAHADSFYISADFARTWQNLELSGESWTYGGGENGIVDSDSGKTIVSPDMEFNHFAPGGNKTSASNRASLAFGADLAPRFSLPVRIEIEGSMRDIMNAGYEKTYGEYGSGNNATIPRTETFGAQQFLRVKFASLMLNGYYDLRNPTRFTPFAGVGIGASHYDAKLTSEITIVYKEQTTIPGINIGTADRPQKFTQEQSGWLFTMSATAGVAFKCTETVILDLAYKYSYVQDISFEPSWMGTYNSLIIKTSGQTLSTSIHQITLGLRIIL